MDILVFTLGVEVEHLGVMGALRKWGAGSVPAPPHPSQVLPAADAMVGAAPPASRSYLLSNGNAVKFWTHL